MNNFRVHNSILVGRDKQQNMKGADKSRYLPENKMMTITGP
jgi:hypothetical protein